jgi:outer membrane protein insertion porin family
MKKLFLFFTLITAFSLKGQVQLGAQDTNSINYISPKEYEVGGITISGTQYFDQNAIIMITGLHIGEKIQVPGTKISEAIDNLWKQGFFEDVGIYAAKIQGNTIFLDIKVTERPRLSKFSFKGLNKSEADDVREKIKLVKGKVFTDYLSGSIESMVKEHFMDKGYANVKVNLVQQNDTTLINSTIVIIEVKKGKKVRIKEVLFEGNSQISDKKLRKPMKNTKPKRWWNPFNSGKFLEENYVQDKTKMIQKYASKGYRDAHIIKDTVYKISNDRVGIKITIDEGRKYYFRNITWVGNTKYSSKELNSVLAIKKGDVFDQTTLDTRLTMNPNGYDVSSVYMDDGYLFFQVTPVEILVENDSIDLEIRIYEGKQATINKVTVVGNTKTNDHVIMREIRTKPGELFRRSDIIRTQRELSQLGYFDNEKLGVNPTPNQTNGTVDIEYVVEEKPSDQVELSGGWGGGRVVGSLGVSFNNFSARNIFKGNTWKPLPSGDGQRLSLRAQSTGLFYQSYNASFTEPWLGGKKPNSLSVTVYHSIQSNGLPKRKTIDGERILNPSRQSLTISGVSVGLGKRLEKPDDYFTLYMEGSYSLYTLKNFHNVFSFTDGQSNNISARFNISRNSINDPIFPRYGSQISLTAQFTPPYSYFNGKDYATLSAQERYKFVEYNKWKFSAAWYTPLTNKKAAEGKEARNLVLYTKAGFGFLGMYNKKVGLSPFERFYLGGSGLTGFNLDGREIIALRGYDDGTVSPITGAAFINKFTVELRFPISLNPSATIYALSEAGNSWANFKDFNPFEIKRSAGVGLRVFLPMFGLLGLDYGWRFDDLPRYPLMQKSQFHFTIGMALGEL